MSQNPFGLSTVTTYLLVESAQSLLEFLKEVFHIKLRGEISYRADGTFQHAEFYLGDSLIMIGEATADQGKFPFTKAGLYTYVEDCDAVFRKAISLGAISLMEPQNFPHGDRYGGFLDPAGNTWWVVTHIQKLQND